MSLPLKLLISSLPAPPSIVSLPNLAADCIVANPAEDRIITEDRVIARTILDHVANDGVVAGAAIR